jgi:hypothetical protein
VRPPRSRRDRRADRRRGRADFKITLVRMAPTAHGFTIDQTVKESAPGLASATAERVVASSRKFEVARV